MSKSSSIILAGVLSICSIAEGQYRNYSLRCLAPILESIDPNAPQTLQEAFLAGPNQFAEPLPGIGAEAIRFPISTESAEAQDLFEQGVALLHVLWYKEAERAFRTVVELDPDCPMGYWGLAQANERTPRRAGIFAEAAKDRCDRNRPEIEQRWTELLANHYVNESDTDRSDRSTTRVRALEELSMDFPDHQEVRAFLIRRLTLDQFVAGLPVTSTLGVDTLADRFAEDFPNHPSGHYRVFLWMNRRPDRILEEAADMTKLAPRAAEIWRYAAEAHLAAGRLSEAAIYAEASLRTDHDDLSRRNLMPWQAQNLRDNFTALIDLLTYAGRIDDATTWAKRALLLPRELEGRQAGNENAWVNVRMAAGQWETLLNELDSDQLLRASGLESDAAFRLLSRGIARLALGQGAEADEIAEEFAAFERKAIIGGISSAEENTIAESRETLKRLRLLFSSDASESPPPSLDGIGIPMIVKARLLEQAGDTGKAYEQMRVIVDSQPYQWLPTAYFSSLADRAGHKREALFPIDRRFRIDASRADEELDIFEDLNELAQELKLPEDWKIAAASPEVPFQLESLGPETWQAPEAPEFQLPDRLGKSRSLDEFSGRPVLLNFFLGVQCAFCLEQFDTFQPHYSSFTEAGIEIVAISIDSAGTLKKLLGEEAEMDPAYAERFPFPVLADPDLGIFRKYGVFDEFENGPMHGTVLVGPEGEILWRNISHTPFQAPAALLGEAKRLFASRSASDSGGSRGD